MQVQSKKKPVCQEKSAFSLLKIVCKNNLVNGFPDFPSLKIQKNKSCVINVEYIKSEKLTSMHDDGCRLPCLYDKKNTIPLSAGSIIISYSTNFQTPSIHESLHSPLLLRTRKCCSRLFLESDCYITILTNVLLLKQNSPHKLSCSLICHPENISQIRDQWSMHFFLTTTILHTLLSV